LVTNCPQCGARLDAPPGPTAYVHTCHYCQAKIPIEPVAAPAPPPRGPVHIEVFGPGAGAPAQISREQMMAAQAAIKTTGKTVGCIIVGGVLLPILIPALIFAVPAMRGCYASHFASFPVEVGLNDSLELNKCEGTLNDTMITVGTNGKLTLRNCHLKSGNMVIKAGINAEIKIIDSTLEGAKGVIDADEANVVVTVENSTLTSPEEIIDEGASNLKFTATKGSKLHAGAIGIPASNNAEVTLDNSKLEAKFGGIDIKNNGKVKLTGGASVRSDLVAIRLENNGHLQVTGSRVEGKTKGIQADNGLEATLRTATVIGPQAALDIGNNAHVTSYGSTLTGPKLVTRLSTFEEH
jgi:hypothetical protein